MTPRLIGLLLVALLPLSACGEGGAQEQGGWTRSEAPVDRGGIVYASGGVVHVGGTRIDTRADGDLAGYVVAGDGVYFVADAEGGSSGELFLATVDGVASTGARAAADSLRASPDGRHLAFIDTATGERDGFGTPVAQAVVVDLGTGEEVVRSAEGMGDPEGGDDLADLYEDAEGPDVLAVTAETAYVVTPDGVIAYDLSSGEGEDVATSTADLRDEDWYRELVSPGTLTNPAGTWTIQNRYDGGPPRLVPDRGEPVITAAPFGLWSLTRWLDDETALGSADPSGEGGVVLLTCPVPTGDCEAVPGTEGGVTLPSDQPVP